jgi:ribosomal protein L11 methyltransferase
MEIGAVATALTDANAGTSQEHAIFGEPLVGTVHGGAYSRHSVWNVCNVTAWFADSVNLTQVVELVRTSSSSSFLAEESPEDKTSGELLDFKIQTVDDRDWIVHVQQSWKPVVVGRFVLKFPWHDEHTVQHALQLSLSVGDPVASDNDDPKRTSTVDPPIVLELQGGVAFGTGEHATTQLCLEWIESTVTEHLSRSGDGGGSSYSSSADDDNAATPRVQVLDYGAGSGILGMAACALDPAAVSCVGIDIDVDACRIANDNANRNRLDMRTYLPPTSLLQTHPDDAESQSLLLKAHRQAILFPRRRYDDAGGERDGAESDVVLPDELDMQQFPIVVANILAAPLTQLAPSLMRRVEPGGRLGLSGVLHHQAESVLRAYQQEGLEKGRVQERLGDWVLITGTKAS